MLPLALGFGGPYDIAIIAAVVLLLFGGSKLAGFGKSIGSGIKEFKSAVKDADIESGSSSSSSVNKNTDSAAPTA